MTPLFARLRPGRIFGGPGCFCFDIHRPTSAKARHDGLGCHGVRIRLGEWYERLRVLSNHIAEIPELNSVRVGFVDLVGVLQDVVPFRSTMGFGNDDLPFQGIGDGQVEDPVGTGQLKRMAEVGLFAVLDNPDASVVIFYQGVDPIESLGMALLSKALHRWIIPCILNPKQNSGPINFIVFIFYLYGCHRL